MSKYLFICSLCDWSTSISEDHSYNLPRASSYVFWIGDLNFRLADPTVLTGAEIKRLVACGELKSLLDKDQLRQAMALGSAFSEMTEQLPNFPPTYKFNFHNSTYDLKWVQRIVGVKCLSIMFSTLTVSFVHTDGGLHGLIGCCTLFTRMFMKISPSMQNNLHTQVCLNMNKAITNLLYLSSSSRWSLSQYIVTLFKMKQKKHFDHFVFQVFSDYHDRMVEFMPVEDWYLEEMNSVFCHIGDDVKLSPWDWVGLYKVLLQI